MRKIFLILGFYFLFGTGAVGAEITKDEALSQFVKAGFVYKNEHYKEAAFLYEGILRKGLENGALYYNLGNSYFKQGLLGRAILNYERALLLIPRDSDLRANYKYAHSLAKNHNGIHEKSVWEKMLEKHIQFYTMDEMAIILVVLMVVIAGSYLFSLYFSWSPRPTARWLSILLFVFSIYLVGFVVKSQSEEDLIITVAVADSRFEPREGATIHFKMPEGGKAKILKDMGAWVKIRRLDGKTGWILRESIAYLRPS